MNIFEKRREKLRALMKENNLDNLLISLPANRYYLSGFELHDGQINESSGCLLVRGTGEDVIFTDARYFDALCRIWTKQNVHIYKSLSSAPEEINKFLRASNSGCNSDCNMGRSKGSGMGNSMGSGLVGFESKIMSVAFFEVFSQGIAITPADGLVEELRVIKDATEIEKMRATALLNHNLMAAVPEFLRPGRTEKEVAFDIEHFFRKNGASENAFSPIVAVGPNAALPHAIPGEDKILEECPVLVDVGARLNDYNSDQTRTFWVGQNPTEAFLKTLKEVQKAQRKAIEAIRPGKTGRDIYQVAYASLEGAGAAKYFTHGLGHGVGLETHEAPYLNSRSLEVLKPGMVVTVEPGLYYPEWGGVRWEHMILVTEEGYEVL